MTKARDIADSTKTLDVDGGTIKLDGNYPTGSNNVALGDAAFGSGNLTGGSNTAIGREASFSNTSGQHNVALGQSANYAITTGTSNVGVGSQALRFTTTADNNTAVGYQAVYTNTTGTANVGLGAYALYSNTTASSNTAVGYQAALDNTTGSALVALGNRSLYENTTGTSNVAAGSSSLRTNTTGNYNTALGDSALRLNTTASQNNAVGYQAGYSNTTGGSNNIIGWNSGYANSTGTNNTFIGNTAGYSATSSYNTFVGRDSGYYVTSGQKNTILGAYTGNQGGLDIRTTNNNIVLSDGDGNPWMHYDYSARSNTGGWLSKVGAADMAGANNTNNYGFHLGTDGFNEFKRVNGQSPVVRFALQGATGNVIEFRQNAGLVGWVSTNGSSVAFSSASDYRLKENVVYDWDATTRLKQLKPARFNFIADAEITVDGFIAHEAQAVVPECASGTHNEVDDDGAAVMQGIDQSKLVPLLVKTIQELEARITALEGA